MKTTRGIFYVKSQKCDCGEIGGYRIGKKRTKKGKIIYIQRARAYNHHDGTQINIGYPGGPYCPECAKKRLTELNEGIK